MKKKKIISLILSLIMIIGVAPINSLTSFADDDIVEVSSADELAALAVAVKGGNHFEGKTVKLTQDIDLGSIESWNPIGYNLNNYFSGVFDGGFHTIYNLRHDSSIDSGNIINMPYQAVGLFGSCKNATIKNVKLDTVSINLINSSGYHNTYSAIDGTNIYTGGLVGYAVGTVIDSVSLENVSVTGKTQSEAGTCYTGGLVGYASSGTSIIYSSVVSGIVNGASSSVNGNSCAGGLVGLIKDEGSVRQSFNAATVNGGHSTGRASTGGIVGKMENSTVETAYIMNCYNSGTVNHAGSWLETGELGGIAGYAYGSITNCYNSGSVIANTNTVGGDVYVGGIAGNANSITQISNCAVISSKISGGTKRYIVSGGGTKSNNFAVSGIGGSPTNDASSLFSSVEFTTSALFVNQLGWDFSAIWSIENGELPKLRIKDANSEKIELVIAALAETYIIYSEGDDYSAVNGDISFHNPENGCAVSWSSDKETVINSATGHVSRQKNDCMVRITALVEKDDYSLSKTFVLNVVGTETEQSSDALDWAMTTEEAKQLVAFMKHCKTSQIPDYDEDVLILTGQCYDEDKLANFMAEFMSFLDVPMESAYLKSKMGDVIGLIKDGTDEVVNDFVKSVVGDIADTSHDIQEEALAEICTYLPRSVFNMTAFDFANIYVNFKEAADFSTDPDALALENYLDGLDTYSGCADSLMKVVLPDYDSNKVFSVINKTFDFLSLFKAFNYSKQNAIKGYISQYLDLRKNYEPDDVEFRLAMEAKTIVDGNVDYNDIDGLCENLFYLYSKFCNNVDDEYKIIIQCPVDVFVFDRNGMLAGSVVDNTIIKKNASIGIRLSGEDNDEKTIFIRGSEQYSVLLKGNDAGSMNITVEKISANDRQRTEYNNIPLVDGNEMLLDIASATIDSSEIVDLHEGVFTDSSKQSDNNSLEHQVTVFPAREMPDGSLTYMGPDQGYRSIYLNEGADLLPALIDESVGVFRGVYNDPECKEVFSGNMMPGASLVLYAKYYVNDDRIRITEQPAGKQYILGDEPEAITVGYESDYDTDVQWYSIESDGSRQQIENVSGASFIPDITDVGEKKYVAVVIGVDGDEDFSAMTEQVTISVIERQSVVSGITGDLQWDLYNDGELVFTGNGAPASYASGQAPWHQYADDITKVTFDGAITKIGSCMFEDCANLSALTIPDSVTSIEENALKGCVGLTELTIPFVGSARTARDTYDAVFGYVFGRIANDADGVVQYFKDEEGSLSGYKYAIPASLKKVAVTDASLLSFGAFNNCDNVEEITLNDGIVSIAGYAFKGDSSLKSMSIPDSVETIEEFALSGCTSLESVELPFVGGSRNVTNDYTAVFGFIFGRTNEDGTQQFFEFSDGSLYSYVYDIPESLKKVTVTDDPSIALAAFSNCTSLKEIIFDDSTSEFEDFVFYGISSLDRLEIRNRNCSIIDNYDTFAISGTIYGYSGSTAEAFANGKNITFVPIDGQHVHIWNNGEITKEASCKEEGVKTFTCTVCGDTKTEPIEKADHTPQVMPAVAATCKATGLTEGSKCSVCGDILVAQEETPKIAHSWNNGEITKETSCKEAGVKTFTCTACGDTKTEPIEKADHTPQVMPAVAATCKATGLTEGSKCSVCDDILVAQEETPKIAHSWNDGEITKNATCEEDGIKTLTCTSCGDTKTECIKAIGHRYGSWETVKIATCTEEGLERRICTNDENHVETRRIPKLAHHDGSGDGLCDDCGASVQAPVQQSNCACGQYHSGPFAGLIKFFHTIIYFFKNLFK
ncbi:MAG: leucine-rich repeat protein [Clostridia bacterium]|nr:leucine-rich repeat protein [Clostridia bacterium]